MTSKLKVLTVLLSVWLFAVQSCMSAVPYPIEATWFANRWSVDEWVTALKPFKDQGGTTIWQRGVPLVQRDEAFFYSDPDWAWCEVSLSLSFSLISTVISTAVSCQFSQ